MYVMTARAKPPAAACTLHAARATAGIRPQIKTTHTLHTGHPAVSTDDHSPHCVAHTSHGHTAHKSGPF
eukprot:6106811-Prymnesium_polylepis.1